MANERRNSNRSLQIAADKNEPAVGFRRAELDPNVLAAPKAKSRYANRLRNRSLRTQCDAYLG